MSIKEDNNSIQDKDDSIEEESLKSKEEKGSRKISN